MAEVRSKMSCISSGNILHAPYNIYYLLLILLTGEGTAEETEQRPIPAPVEEKAQDPGECGGLSPRR